MTSKVVGIDGLGVSFPNAYLALEDLANARGVAPAKFTEGLGTLAMAVPGPEEDTVTLAAAAARDALERAQLDASDIGLCIVGTETAVDHSKPVSSFLQGLLGLPPTCRIFETKHACYGGTAGLMTALDWIRSGSARGRSALVICSDIARYGLRTAGEPTQGAGSVALVVSADPRVVAIDTESVGTSSKHVFDFWRPLDSKDALVDGHYSQTCYLDALGEAHAEHTRLAEVARGAGAAGPRELAATLYHVPYPKMARKAHRFLRERLGDSEPEASFERLVAPSLVLPAQIGNIYTGSLYLALASLLACSREPLEGRDISFFSYGSGCCAELFVGRVAAGAQQAYASLLGRLEHRRRLSVEEYEAMFAPQSLLEIAMPAAGLALPPGAVRLQGVSGGRRVYG